MSHSRRPAKKQKNQPVKLAHYITTNTRHARRDLPNLIRNGQVSVNNQPVDQFNLEIRPGKDTVKISDTPISTSQRVVYLYHKPAGMISTLSDPKGRRNLSEIIQTLPEGVKPVGRLDRNTSGLMILTNDGHLAQELNHPTHHVEKTYTVTLDKAITQGDLNRLLNGFFLEDGPVQFIHVQLITKSQLSVVIAEGRNRIVRRSFEHLGYLVKKLKRTIVGPYQLGRLGVGEIIKLDKTHRN